MKVLLVLATFIVAVQLAEIPWTDPSSPDKYAVHYNSHKGTIQEARKLVAERLQEFGASDDQLTGNELQSVGANGDTACTVSCVNGGKTSSSAATDFQEVNREVGVGYVGFNGADSSNSEFAAETEFSSSQNNAGAAVVIPGGSNSQSVYQQANHQVSRNNAGFVAPVVVGGAASDSEQFSQSEITSQNSPGFVSVYPGNAGSSESFTSNVNHVSETKAAPVHIISYPVGGASQRYSSNTQRVSETKAANPVRIAVYPSGGESERYLSHSEQSSETRNAPAPAVIYPAGGSESRFNSRLEHSSESRASAPVVQYTSYPAVGSQRYVSNINHVSETNSAPVPIIQYPIGGGGSERYVSRSERISEQRRPAPVPIVYQPAYGSSERYVSSNHRATVNSAPTPIIYSPPRTSERFVSRQEHFRDSAQTQPIVTYIQPSAASHSSRYTNEESRSNTQQHQPILINYPSNQFSSSSNNFEHDSQSSFGGASHYPVVGNSAGSFDQNSNSNYHSTYGQRPSSRVGSSRRYTSGASEDLSSYMSEAERLARAQSQTGNSYGSANVGSAGYGNAHNGAGYESANLGFGNNLAAGNSGNGGFVRTKSWENNEKWASGSEYDENGKLRTYSNLSTGESELHNVNGKVAGYKAATTTVEDNGRTSTYSIHT